MTSELCRFPKNRLEALLDEFPEMDEDAIDSEVRERMEALGYLGK